MDSERTGEPKLDIEEAVEVILDSLGYDRSNQHFQDTPRRVAEMLYGMRKNGDPEAAGKLLEVAFIEPGAVDSLVLEGPISYSSMCAHHMLTVEGVAYVGYLPNHAVCGLSKLARVVHHFSEQLTVQEVVTQQIANALDDYLQPLGTMVVVNARHGCMSIRGVRERECYTKTSAVRGVFKDSLAARSEFFALMNLERG
jgi:GTP cyclohydrolase I